MTYHDAAVTIIIVVSDSSSFFKRYDTKHQWKNDPVLTTYNPRVEPEFVLILTLTTRLEFVLIYPGIRFVDPQYVDHQGSDICGKQLSTFDIIFNLLLLSQAKVRIKEPASKILNNTTAVDCRQYKKPYNNTKSKAINFGRERRHRKG